LPSGTGTSSIAICPVIEVRSESFPSIFGHSVIEISLSTSSARAFTSSLTLISPLGQSGNLARTLANNLLATIFSSSEDFFVWRYFHLYLFAEICSAIIVAAIFWYFILYSLSIYYPCKKFLLIFKNYFLGCSNMPKLYLYVIERR